MGDGRWEGEEGTVLTQNQHIGNPINFQKVEYVTYHVFFFFYI